MTNGLRITKEDPLDHARALIKERFDHSVELNRIIELVAGVYEIAPDDIKGPSRLEKHVHARLLVYWLATDAQGIDPNTVDRLMGKGRKCARPGAKRFQAMVETEPDTTGRIAASFRRVLVATELQPD